ncbi:MAG: hypothetical protein ABWW66_02920 [Archaeoglobaceae archaeon]
MDRRVRDAMIAERIVSVAEKSVELARKVASNIEDPAAKVQAFLNLYRFTGDEEFLKLALEAAEDDDDYLRIVEAGCDVADLISDGYKRDVAYATLLERTGDMNYLTRISDRRIASAAMKRLAAKKLYPESLRIARLIPDAYYRALALMEIAEKEGIDLSAEIEAAIAAVENRSLRDWLSKKFKSRRE